MSTRNEEGIGKMETILVVDDNKINLKDKDILVKTSSPYLDKEILSISEKKIKIFKNCAFRDRQTRRFII